MYCLKSTILTGMIVIAIFTISFSLIAEPVFGQMNTYMSPRHQMQMMNDPTNVVCQQGMVLMMKNSTGNPVCVNTSSYWRLADRYWGVFDTSLLNQNPQHMQGVMGSMMNHPQMSNYMHNWMTDNPQHMQTMMDSWMPQMMQNNSMMMNMMGPMMNDPELHNQMMTHMMNHPQMMQDMKTNQQWMGMMMGQGMMMNGMYHGMMMNSTMNCPWCPFMHDSQMNQDMMGMNCPWCSGNMGQGMMMGKGHMMGQGTMKNPVMMTNQTMGHGWTLHNPQHMHGMMNQMMTNPDMMPTMHGMMMQNPQHMHGMTNHMMGPMITHMMNDPDMRQQMMTHMINHPQMMEQWMQNQTFMDQMNNP